MYCFSQLQSVLCQRKISLLDIKIEFRPTYISWKANCIVSCAIMQENKIIRILM